MGVQGRSRLKPQRGMCREWRLCGSAGRRAGCCSAAQCSWQTPLRRLVPPSQRGAAASAAAAAHLHARASTAPARLVAAHGAAGRPPRTAAAAVPARWTAAGGWRGAAACGWEWDGGGAWNLRPRGCSQGARAQAKYQDIGGRQSRRCAAQQQPRGPTSPLPTRNALTAQARAAVPGGGAPPGARSGGRGCESSGSPRWAPSALASGQGGAGGSGLAAGARGGEGTCCHKFGHPRRLPPVSLTAVAQSECCWGLSGGAAAAGVCARVNLPSRSSPRATNRSDIAFRDATNRERRPAPIAESGMSAQNLTGMSGCCRTGAAAVDLVLAARRKAGGRCWCVLSSLSQPPHPSFPT